MAEICCGLVGESSDASAKIEKRRRRQDLLPFTLLSDSTMPQLVLESSRKRARLDLQPRECGNAVENSSVKDVQDVDGAESEGNVLLRANPAVNTIDSLKSTQVEDEGDQLPKFGVTSVCGRRRDMEDAVSIHPYFCNQKDRNSSDMHFFGVFDGHGCSHVAMKCKERLHHIVREELEGEGETVEWKSMMERSFARMDMEVKESGDDDHVKNSNCRCEFQTPQCDAVGSTAVATVLTRDKIIVSNCGDSRAVLCRKGVAIPLSSDHKPDRPDELARIQEAGGRVIYWDGARVLGVLAMSRAIGDNYLKPFVIPEPEVVMMDRTAEDECMIIATDGLWDVVTNDTACSVARMCLRAQKPRAPPRSPGSADVAVGLCDSSDRACSDASILLTKLALARHSTDNVSVVVVDLKGNRNFNSLSQGKEFVSLQPLL